jgi:hypothetical protein
MDAINSSSSSSPGSSSDSGSGAASAASYKQLKEDFVSNLSGGSVAEINYVTAIAPVRDISHLFPCWTTNAGMRDGAD